MRRSAPARQAAARPRVDDSRAIARTNSRSTSVSVTMPTSAATIHDGQRPDSSSMTSRRVLDRRHRLDGDDPLRHDVPAVSRRSGRVSPGGKLRDRARQDELQVAVRNDPTRSSDPAPGSRARCGAGAAHDLLQVGLRAARATSCCVGVFTSIEVSFRSTPLLHDCNPGATVWPATSHGVSRTTSQLRTEGDAPVRRSRPSSCPSGRGKQGRCGRGGCKAWVTPMVL